jgi:hypothetical protein
MCVSMLENFRDNVMQVDYLHALRFRAATVFPNDTIELVYIVPGLIIAALAMLCSIGVLMVALVWRVAKHSLFLVVLLCGVLLSAALRTVYWTVALVLNVNPGLYGQDFK